jgi:hypothetical protein
MQDFISSLSDEEAATILKKYGQSGEAPKVDGMATVNSIAAKTGLRAQAVAGWADENGVNLSKVSADIDSKKLKPMDLMTAVVGNPNNKYAKDIIAKYSQSTQTPTPKGNMGVDSVVYNKRTNTVGIVRIADERGETKTDADGNVNTSELEPYNPMKYPHQKDAQAAPSTKKEVDSRGLWNPFNQTDNPKVEPKADGVESLTSYKDFNKFFKANSDKINKNDLAYIEDEIGALKYLESDYKRGNADRDEVDTAYLDLQDLIKKAMGSSMEENNVKLKSLIKRK